MHRILNIAGNEKNKDDLIEQPAADFIFITSVKTDLNLISNLLLEKEFAPLKNNIRALEISNLNSSAQIDNYLLKTINYAKVVVLRIFGDKGTWNYGIEQLLNWQAVNKKRKLVILSGTDDQEVSLSEISSIDKNIALIEVGRGLGGRSSTRISNRFKGWKLNHGAPNFNISNRKNNLLLKNYIDELLENKLIKIDNSEIFFLNEDLNSEKQIKSEFSCGVNYLPLYSMSQLSQKIIESNNLKGNIDFYFETLIVDLNFNNKEWLLTSKNGDKFKSK